MEWNCGLKHGTVSSGRTMKDGQKAKALWLCLLSPDEWLYVYNIIKSWAVAEPLAQNS